MKKAQTFVLVHGAWHGGWCWKRVAHILRSQGHVVSTPTLTGLGERAHLLSKSIDFDTFVIDIQNHIAFERLDQVVLVGHSFGGNVVTVVADRIVSRVKRIIYLDADIAEDGGCAMDQLPRPVVQERLRLSQESSGGLTMPCPPPEAFGVFQPADKTFLKDRLTPHPIKTYLSRVKMRNPAGNGLPCDFILCTEPDYGLMNHALSVARAANWPLHELRTGHDAMITAAQETAALLEKIVSVS